MYLSAVQMQCDSSIIYVVICPDGPKRPTQYITALTKKKTSSIENIILFECKPVGQPGLWGPISSSDMVSHTPTLLSTDVTLCHWGLGAEANGPIACEYTRHPLACHCVIRQKIRPNSWVLRTLLPLFYLTDALWCKHMRKHTHKQSGFRMIY